MTEEATPVAPATEQTPPAKPTTQAPVEKPVASMPPAEPATGPSWVKDLDTADPELVRKHPRVMAIVGELFGKRIAAERQRITEEQSRSAQKTVEEQMLALLEDNEESIAQRYPAVAAHIKRLKDTRGDRQAQEARSEALNRMAAAIGKGYQAVPEWAELTPEDHESLAKSIASLPDDDVLPTYNARALDIVAERRAAKKATERIAREIEKEREAIRKEESARLLKEQSAPDMATPKAAATSVNINAMSDKEFDEYWSKRFSR